MILLKIQKFNFTFIRIMKIIYVKFANYIYIIKIKMGFLSDLGKTLSYDESKKLQLIIKKFGID